MKTLISGGVLKNCVAMSKFFIQGLERLKRRFPFVRGIRGRGLLLGMELEMEGAKIVDVCMQEGLLLNCTAYKVLRFAPPLTIKKNEIENGLAVLEKVLAAQ
jgi:acetylornithine/succinyldiaminopimelate/putrescine aminotransferase